MNFSKVTVSTGYDDTATSIVLNGSEGAKLPTVPFNAVWWNSTDYSDPSDDPNKEIVRVTAISTDTLTVTRGQESITATTKNTGGKTYKMIAGLTALNANLIITGPTSSTDNAILRFDGTTGKLGQNSTVTVDDNGNTTFAAGNNLTIKIDDNVGNPGNQLTIAAGKGAANENGGGLRLNGGAGGTGSTSGAIAQLKGGAGGSTGGGGGTANISGGNGTAAGTAAGDVVLENGTPGSGGTKGRIIVNDTATGNGAILNPTSLSANRIFTFPDTAGTFALLSTTINTGDVIVIHKNGTSTSYTAASNTDIARGTVLLSAVSAAVTGDVIYLDANTFDVVTTQIDLSIGNTGTVSLVGSGKYSTIINSQHDLADNKAIVRPGNNSVVSDLSIVGNAANGIYQAPWGCGTADTAFTNAVLRNVYLYAQSDGIYIYKNGCSAEIVNVTISTLFDCINVGGTTASIKVWDSVITCVASSLIDSGNIARGVVFSSSSGTITLINCIVSATNGAVTNNGFLVQAGTMNVYGGSATTSGTGTTVDLFNNASTLNVTANTVYNPTRVSGVINKINSGVIDTQVVTLTDGATPSLDASLGNTFDLVAAGNRTIGIPTNPVDGQKITIRHKASGGARTLALNSGSGGFRFGTDITGLTATSSGATDYIGAIYTQNHWDVVAYVKGFATISSPSPSKSPSISPSISPS